jgi:hypothetical protein
LISSFFGSNFGEGGRGAGSGENSSSSESTEESKSESWSESFFALGAKGLAVGLVGLLNGDFANALVTGGLEAKGEALLSLAEAKGEDEAAAFANGDAVVLA